ncbi:hypothetical protein KC325_g229 [Hortaea werneckii]|nr:hypothetical protein KC325_g229 [Hortaea werneckii]
MRAPEKSFTPPTPSLKSILSLLPQRNHHHYRHVRPRSPLYLILLITVSMPLSTSKFAAALLTALNIPRSKSSRHRKTASTQLSCTSQYLALRAAKASTIGPPAPAPVVPIPTAPLPPPAAAAFLSALSRFWKSFTTRHLSLMPRRRILAPRVCTLARYEDLHDVVFAREVVVEGRGDLLHAALLVPGRRDEEGLQHVAEVGREEEAGEEVQAVRGNEVMPSWGASSMLRQGSRSFGIPGPKAFGTCVGGTVGLGFGHGELFSQHCPDVAEALGVKVAVGVLVETAFFSAGEGSRICGFDARHPFFDCLGDEATVFADKIALALYLGTQFKVVHELVVNVAAEYFRASRNLPFLVNHSRSVPPPPPSPVPPPAKGKFSINSNPLSPSGPRLTCSIAASRTSLSSVSPLCTASRLDWTSGSSSSSLNKPSSSSNRSEKVSILSFIASTAAKFRCIRPSFSISGKSLIMPWASEQRRSIFSISSLIRLTDLLPSVMALRVDCGLFAREFGFEQGKAIEVIRVFEEIGEVGGGGFVVVGEVVVGGGGVDEVGHCGSTRMGSCHAVGCGEMDIRQQAMEATMDCPEIVVLVVVLVLLLEVVEMEMWDWEWELLLL